MYGRRELRLLHDWHLEELSTDKSLACSSFFPRIEDVHILCDKNRNVRRRGRGSSNENL